MIAAPFLMQWLAGTWFVIASDAPIWLKGDKVSPTLNYTLEEKHGQATMLDETKYYKHARQHTIAGYDHSVPGDAAAFVWRGKGLLFFVTSKWRVCLQDEAGAWAVIAYSKTLFTPEGIDILCRKPAIDTATMEHIRKMILQDSTLAKHAKGLKMAQQP